MALISAVEVEADGMLCGLNMLVSTPSMYMTDITFSHSSEQFNVINEQLNLFSVLDVCLYATDNT